VSVTITAMSGTGHHEAGLASGLVNMGQQVGGALGLALLATVADSRSHSLLAHGGHTVGFALTKGFDRAFVVGAGFAFTGAVLALVLIGPRRRRSEEVVDQRTGARQASVAAGDA
jgi:sugar phosphate permease